MATRKEKKARSHESNVPGSELRWLSTRIDQMSSQLGHDVWFVSKQLADVRALLDQHTKILAALHKKRPH